MNHSVANRPAGLGWNGRVSRQNKEHSLHRYEKALFPGSQDAFSQRPGCQKATNVVFC